LDKSITITLLRLYKNTQKTEETVKHRTILLSYCFRVGGAFFLDKSITITLLRLYNKKTEKAND